MQTRRITPLRSLIATAVLGAALCGSAWAAAATGAVSVKSGGVTVDEFAEMNREASAHSLKMVLAAKGSGAYIADVDVTVRALPSREVVVEHRTNGPLLLATLPPGRYEVSATYKDVKPGSPRTQTRQVSVGQGRTQMVLYFDTGDDLSPDSVAEYRTR